MSFLDTSTTGPPLQAAERISGSLVPKASASDGPRPRTWARGRRCAADGCGTVLSMYNPSHVCAVHAKALKTAETHPPAERVARLAACAHCGAEFEALKASRRYCSDRCRMAAYQARQRAADLEHLAVRTSDRFA